MLVNPWGLWWREISTSDICEVGANGRVVDGRWDVTPAIYIHTELHRLRPDARVVVHNHPYQVTMVAALDMLPEVLHENGSPRHHRHRRHPCRDHVPLGDHKAAVPACVPRRTVAASGSRISEPFTHQMRASQLERAAEPYENGAVCLLLKDEPDVLE